MALQFQDRVAQWLGHVADELAEMRKTIHLPLELLTNETPVLGGSRRKEVASAWMHARLGCTLDNASRTDGLEGSRKIPRRPTTPEAR